MNVRKLGGRGRLTLSTVTVEFRNAIGELGTRVERIILVLVERGFRPLPEPPVGYRWKTAGEYRDEFNDPLTTNARRQEIMAIRLMLKLPDTVALPPAP